MGLIGLFWNRRCSDHRHGGQCGCGGLCGLRLGWLQPKGGAQLIQEGNLCVVAHVISVTNTQCHLVGKLARLRRLQARSDRGGVWLVEQHLLAQRGHVHLIISEGGGDLADLLALTLVLVAIDEGRHQTQHHDGFGFVSVQSNHEVWCLGLAGKNLSRVARVGAGVSRLTTTIQKAEPRHMNMTGM